MPFVTIINAAVILSGGKPTSELGDHKQIGDKDSLSGKIAQELWLGAQLRKLAATKSNWAGRQYGPFSNVDLDDARAFIQERGILPSALEQSEKRRDKQMRLLKAKAEELGIHLVAPKLGQVASLRDALQEAYPSLFTNWLDIWKYAKSRGIAKPVK